MIDCESVANEELKRLRDMQRLLQAISMACGIAPASLGLEEVL